LGCIAHTGRYLAGVRIRHGEVVDGLSALCVSLFDGNWTSSILEEEEPSASTNNPFSGKDERAVLCPQHHLVTGFRVYNKTHANTTAVGRVQLRCTRFNAQGQAQETVTTTGQGGTATNGVWNPIWADCPTSHPIAQGVDSYSGFFIDRMRLRCAAPQWSTTEAFTPDPWMRGQLGLRPTPGVEGPPRLFPGTPCRLRVNASFLNHVADRGWRFDCRKPSLGWGGVTQNFLRFPPNSPNLGCLWTTGPVPVPIPPEVTLEFFTREETLVPTLNNGWRLTGWTLIGGPYVTLPNPENDLPILAFVKLPQSGTNYLRELTEITLSKVRGDCSRAIEEAF
jgi:hypothetical protein